MFKPCKTISNTIITIIKKKKKLNLAKNFLLVPLCWQLALPGNVWAAPTETVESDVRIPPMASEYLHRSSPRESLISVSVLGAVHKPGLYYIPSPSSVVKLLTLAGGGSENGDLTEVILRRDLNSPTLQKSSWLSPTSKRSYRLNLQSHIQSGEQNELYLAQNDVLFVPAKEPLISSDLSRTVSVVSLAMGIVLTSILISKNR